MRLDVRWIRDRWETEDGRYYFDPVAADFAAGFFPEMLEHHIGEFDGLPFTLLDYQRYLVRAAWGWKHVRDGLRRFRKIFLAIPKGSGKSPFGSGLGLLLAFFDHEAGAEVYAVAADKKQAADIVFKTSKIMIDRSAALSSVCEIFRDSIKLKGSTESYQVLSTDVASKHGYRPHGIIFDEFHAQPSRDLFDTLYRGMGKRLQPMLVMITTAGDDDESICYEEWDYARRIIADPSLDETYLPMVFEARPEEDWTAPETWKRVNPGYGITIKAEYFANESRAAQMEPRKRNSFLQLHLNRWVNQAVAWLPIEWWDACPVTLPEESILRTLTASAGLDMAQKIDLAGFVMTFREPLEVPADIEVLTENAVGAIEKKIVSLNYRVHLLPRFWIPENTMREHEKDDRVPYSLWKDRGWIVATDGDVIDYDRIYSDILKLAERFPLIKQGQIGYDPAFATDIALKLAGAGFTVVETPQNYKFLSEPSQVFEALMKAKRISNDGNRAMRWCIENVAVRQDDAGRIRPVKPRKSRKRIDGVVAAIMGIGRLMVQPEQPKKKYQAIFI
jgi:phage terminase large subunit-like protein